MKKFKKRLLILLTLITCIIPTFIYAYSDYIIASGKNIGIQIQAKNILVVGLYEVNGVYPAKEAGIRLGDRITKINNVEVSSISKMVSLLEESTSLTVEVEYIRGQKETKKTNLTLLKDNDNILKSGMYVKDSITGIGTLTFIDPKTTYFGALGHEIIEKNSGQRLEVSGGTIFSSTVNGVNKSSRGIPGEKKATYNKEAVLGNIKENTVKGIFGNYTDGIDETNLKKVAQIEDVKTGKASILTVVNDQEVESFSIEILRINDDKEQKVKNILFEIIDPKLLEITGGVVQGMSGSPIIQDEYIVGAVTHVVVDNAARGYGIFITNMLEEAEN